MHPDCAGKAVRATVGASQWHKRQALAPDTPRPRRGNWGRVVRCRCHLPAWLSGLSPRLRHVAATAKLAKERKAGMSVVEAMRRPRSPFLHRGPYSTIPPPPALHAPPRTVRRRVPPCRAARANIDICQSRAVSGVPGRQRERRRGVHGVGRLSTPVALLGAPYGCQGVQSPGRARWLAAEHRGSGSTASPALCVRGSASLQRCRLRPHRSAKTLGAILSPAGRLGKLRPLLREPVGGRGASPIGPRSRSGRDEARSRWIDSALTCACRLFPLILSDGAVPA